jgi:hypothetical protein
MKEENIRDLGSIHLRDATAPELEHLKKMSDDDLLRASATLDLFAVVESMRRLKNALVKEETAIKGLTRTLVILTGVLLVFTVVLVVLGIFSPCH